MHTLGIIGGGRAAWAYGSSWKRIGWPVDGAWLRNESVSRLPELLDVPRKTLEELADTSDLLLLAVADDAIESVAAAIPATRAIVFHASGAMSHVQGGFSLHPLRVLPPVGSVSDLRNTLLVFEGNHRETAVAIAGAVEARFAEVTTEAKPLYHAAAVFGSNYVAAVLDLAEELMGEAGVDGARSDLAALAGSATANWLAHDDQRRFTGPAARGDADVLRRHLEALRDRPEVAELYGLLADRIASSILARRK